VPKADVASRRVRFASPARPNRAGGLPVTDGDLVVGAAGASGAPSEEDEEAVRTAIERWHADRLG